MTITKETTKFNPFKPQHYLLIVCSIILLGISTSCHTNPQDFDINQHEEAHFVEHGKADKNMKEAQNYFNDKNYKKAIYSFESIEDLTNPELQYFYAIALIETNHYKFAELYLNNLRSGTSIYKEKATWYLALSKFKQNKFDDCKSYLNQIPANAKDYPKAQKLLKDLD